MKSLIKQEKKSGFQLKPDQLRSFFIHHLNRIHCAKAHLFERLPELADQTDFRDLRYAIQETREDIGRQMARIEEIYTLLEEEPSLNNCDELIDFIENGFSTICLQPEEPELRDLSILFYLSLIESVESASFQLLLMSCLKMPDKQIKQLLRENFDETKADRILFLRITEKYFS